MDTTQTSRSHAPSSRADAIASKHDDMNVPLPANETLYLLLAIQRSTVGS